MRTLATIIAVYFISLGISPAQETTPAAGTLTVTTYNLRYASSTPPNAWPERRPLMTEQIRQLSPDVMGTQEGLYPQIKNLAADFPEYDWIGQGRQGGSHDEFGAIFYRKSRLEPLAFDYFWLSDTPDVIGSSTWSNACCRMVTWVQFRDRVTGNEFYVFNTHFDHQSELAREKSAELVRERISTLKTRFPVLLIGDFNATAGKSKTYDILTAGGFLTDAWLAAPKRQGENLDTFNNFRPPQKNGERIDWIFTRGKVTVTSAEISTYSHNGQFPSDHFPVTAVVKLPSTN